MPFRVTCGYTLLSHNALVASGAEDVESLPRDDDGPDCGVTLSVLQGPYYLVGCLAYQGVVHLWPVDCDVSYAVTLVVVDINESHRNTPFLSAARFSDELMSKQSRSAVPRHQIYDLILD